MTAATTGMDLWALRLACAYGLRVTARPHVWPESPLYCEDAGVRYTRPLKLTERELATIERMWREGVSMKRICEVMGMSYDRLSNVTAKDRVRFPYRKPRRGKVGP